MVFGVMKIIPILEINSTKTLTEKSHKIIKNTLKLKFSIDSLFEMVIYTPAEESTRQN